METQEKSITPAEGLEIIEQMIASAKGDIKEDGFLFLFWGWLIFAISIAFYILQFVVEVENSGLVWLGVLVGVVVTIVYVMRKEKKQKVKSFVDEFMAYVWQAFGAALFIILFFGNKLQLGTYPLLIVLYGIGTFISGGALRFKPLMYGGIACWVIAFIAFFQPFQYQILLLALSLLVSYIIPGHILKANHSNGKI